MTHTPSVVTGANVKAEMARLGVSQMVLADALGMGQSGLSKRLRGRIAFDINELTQIALFLGVSIDALVAGVGEAA